MAIIYRCDGCKLDFDESEKLRTITVPYTDKYKQNFCEDNYSREFCIDCWESIIEVIEKMK